MAVRYVVRVGFRWVGALPLYYLTKARDYALLAASEADASRMVTLATERGQDLSDYVIEAVET